jgi:hypothetical protein
MAVLPKIQELLDFIATTNQEQQEQNSALNHVTIRETMDAVKSQLITMSGLIHAYLMVENICPDECAQTYQDIAQFLRS